MNTREQRQVAVLLPLVAVAGLTAFFDLRLANAAGGREPRWYDQYMQRESVQITGTIYDFYKKNKREMSDDFDDKGPKVPKGQYINVLKNGLDAEGRPVFSGGGFLVESTWCNADNHPICWAKQYIAAWPGDHAGKSPKKDAKEQGDVVTDEEDVEFWWRSNPDMNEMFDAPITFTRTSSTQPKGPGPGPDPWKDASKMPFPTASPYLYLFDAQIPKGKQKGPSKKGVDDMLDLIAKGKHKKKRYNFAGETTFVHEAGAGWALRVTSQDDVWVFIDGRLVIDLGGSYKGKEKRQFSCQTIEIDRLNWLADGGTYSLKFFMADRDKGSDKSHLRIETDIATLNLVGSYSVGVNCD